MEYPLSPQALILAAEFWQRFHEAWSDAHGAKYNKRAFCDAQLAAERLIGARTHVMDALRAAAPSGSKRPYSQEPSHIVRASMLRAVGRTDRHLKELLRRHNAMPIPAIERHQLAQTIVTEMIEICLSTLKETSQWPKSEPLS